MCVTVNHAGLKSKFIGALLGAFVGDALGMPVENWPAERIARRFGKLDHLRAARPWLRAYAAWEGLLTDPARSFSRWPLGRGTYTDDTQMTIGVAESLVECTGFDGANMALRFAADFDPRRGYGPGAKRALRAIKRGAAWNEVGTKLFKGGGSFGNGAAMRVAPIGLLYHNDANKLREVAELSASITHAHPLAREGAALQAFAVAGAMAGTPSAGFDANEFVAGLKSFAKPECEKFQRKLDAIASLLPRQPDVREVVETLGNNVTVHGSVPAAIYSFVSHPHDFKECVVYAVGLGGDTDTIVSMAGALAGAYHGVESIPAEWIDALENGPKGRDYVVELAERLFQARCGI